jgi:hypothetical protein
MDSGKLIRYRADYGNIEAIRTLVLLNKLIPNMGSDYSLGSLKIVSLSGHGKGRPIIDLDTFIEKCFTPLIGSVK